MRKVSVRRTTTETDIRVQLNLDGRGRARALSRGYSPFRSTVWGDSVPARRFRHVSALARLANRPVKSLFAPRH